MELTEVFHGGYYYVAHFYSKALCDGLLYSSVFMAPKAVTPYLQS